jgi:hypothetical protein
MGTHCTALRQRALGIVINTQLREDLKYKIMADESIVYYYDLCLSEDINILP